jgi:hypothetical protein
MAASEDGTMGNVCLIVALVFVMIIQSTSFPTTGTYTLFDTQCIELTKYTNQQFADDVRCDVLRQRCVPINCNIQLCRVWYGEYQFKSAFCKRTPPFPDQCCC